MSETMAELAVRDDLAGILQTVLGGDLAPLTPTERVKWYGAVCESVGLNPLTKPFDYIVLNGKLTLYANKNAAEQMRALRGVSYQQLGDARFEQELVILKGRVSLQDGRSDEGTAAVSVKGLSGEALANALMKCETKLKRRLTLSLCGLGLLDETEVDAIPEVQRVTVDHDTGEILRVPSTTPLVSVQNAVTDAQRRTLFATAHEHDWTDEDIRSHIMAEYDLDSTKKLSVVQASDLIEYIVAGGTPLWADVFREPVQP
jgi:hypothetical protein